MYRRGKRRANEPLEPYLVELGPSWNWLLKRQYPFVEM